MDFHQVRFLLIGLTICLLLPVTYGQRRRRPTPGTETCPPLNVTEDCSKISSCKTLRKLDMYADYYSHNCFCDAQCHVFGDCCDDAKKRNRNKMDTELYTCETKHKIDNGDKPVYIVSTCPRDWADTAIRNLCQLQNRSDIFRTWPVMDTGGITYTNVYCAQCHGVLPSGISYYGANFTCDESVDMSSIKNNLRYINKLIKGFHCKVKYRQFDYMKPPRVCKPNLVNTCKDTADACLVDQCTNGPNAYMYDYSYTYKNKACALCGALGNGIALTSCVEGDVHIPLISGFGVSGFFSLSLLLDLNGGTGTMVGHGVANAVNKTVVKFETCEEGYAYDPYINRCRSIGCKFGFRYINGRCVTIDENNNSSDCVRHTYKPNEFHLFSNGAVYINASGRLIDEDEYQISLNGEVLVCANLSAMYSALTHEYVTMFKFDTVQTIISIIGQIISIICLIIHLVVYSLLPPLRNLAGKNVMCLVAALLWAQLLFLIGVGRVKYYGICVFFAIAIHYGFLASFFWMNVMSFDIWRTFSQATRAGSQESADRRFKRYLLYGWLAPLGIVSIAILANFALVDSAYDFRPGYGEGLCWITLRPGLLIFFAVPVFILLICNLVCFILTAYNIHKIGVATKIVNKDDSDRNRFFLYIKLSILMGLTWLFGFIAALADIPPIWYIFVILNSLQGAFICFTFVFTRKVASLLRDWQRSRNREYGRQDSSNPDQTTSSMLSKSRSTTLESSIAASKNNANNANNTKPLMAKKSSSGKDTNSAFYKANML